MLWEIFLLIKPSRFHSLFHNVVYEIVWEKERKNEWGCGTTLLLCDLSGKIIAKIGLISEKIFIYWFRCIICGNGREDEECFA